MRWAAPRSVTLGCAVLTGWVGGPGAMNASAKVEAQRLIQPVGSLAFAWKGDPARGCAGQGLCNVTGSVVVRVGDSASGGASGVPPIELSDDSAVARVDESGVTGTALSACADPQSVDFELRVTRSTGGGLRARSDNGSLGWPSAGRCAGPTAADLAALVLPAQSLGKRGYDLSGSAHFGAGPFAVTVISHIRALVSNDFGVGPGVPSAPNGGPPATKGGPPPPKRRPRLEEEAGVQYRVVGVSGALGAAFSGIGEPACQPYGTCDTTGSLSVSVSASHQTLTFFGSRIVGHRVGEVRALEDLRAGRLNVADTSFGLRLGDRVTGRLRWPDGSTCADTVTAAEAPIQSGVKGHADLFKLAAGSEDFFPGADPLRSRCPGPSSSELVGDGALATGSVPFRDFGAIRLTLRLSASGSFRAPEYQGARLGAIVLTLARARVNGGTGAGHGVPVTVIG